MTYETEQELRDEIATPHDMIRELAGPLLTPRERDVLDRALDGRSIESVADELGMSKPSLFKIANKLRRLGVVIPNWPNHLAEKPAPLRFHKEGITPYGSRVSCAADTQAAADGMIAAMVAP